MHDAGTTSLRTTMMELVYAGRSRHMDDVHSTIETEETMLRKQSTFTMESALVRIGPNTRAYCPTPLSCDYSPTTPGDPAFSR